MSLFVVEVDGRVIAAIAAPLLAEAHEHARSLGFQVTLRTLGSNGPLWDGSSSLHVRAATEKEQSRWTALYPHEDGSDADQLIRTQVPFCEEAVRRPPPWWAFWRRAQ
jgi:hypothetical protein